MTTLNGGLTTWADALQDALGTATCLWQDLDGLHVEAAPEQPPLTSIVWGWRSDGSLLRARIDDNHMYLAICENPSNGLLAQPWSPDDGRVGGQRSAGSVQIDQAYEQIIIYDDSGHTGPITFLRPAASTR